ncbi:MAG: hypothetical protein OXT09_08780 [Myxococcales bacterium]|nr:hypothetical protein [Myxococcales bacterium]
MSSLCRRACVALLALLAVSAGACDDAPIGEGVDFIPGVMTPAATTPADDTPLPGDASSDPGLPPATDAGEAMPPGLPIPTTGSICSVEVGAECDGNEDCPGGEVCCGRFNNAAFRYTEISCAATCGALDYVLCHPGDDCPGETQQCRASQILPYDFVGVCADPADTPTLVGEAIAGEVLCGKSRCTVGEEKCCYRGRFEFASSTNVGLEPYCAPLDAVCSCDGAEEAAMELDAGDELEDDAG